MCQARAFLVPALELPLTRERPETIVEA